LRNRTVTSVTHLADEEKSIENFWVQSTERAPTQIVVFSKAQWLRRPMIDEKSSLANLTPPKDAGN